MTYPMLLSLPVPTTPISALFALFMAVPLLPTHSPTFIYCMPLFSHSSYLLHDPSHSPTPAWPLHPPFCCFQLFMDAFLCIFISYSMYICTHMFISTGYICFDRFFWMQPATRVGEMNI